MKRVDINSSFRWRRLALGFIVGPLVPGILSATHSLVIDHGPDWTNGVILSVGLSAMLGYPLALIMGLPLFFVMKRLAWTRLYHYALAGLLLGAISVLCYCLFANVTPKWPVLWFLKGAAMGMISTISFWFIVRPERHGRSRYGRLFILLALLPFLVLLGTQQSLGATNASRSQPLKCSRGPVVKVYAEASWLVYGCDDNLSLVVVTAPSNPASPFQFTLSFEEGRYRLYGEGAGKNATTTNAFNELSRLSSGDIDKLIKETKNQQQSR